MKIKLFDFYNDEVALEDIEREVNEFCEGKNVIDIRTICNPETNHEYRSYTVTVLYEEADDDSLNVKLTREQLKTICGHTLIRISDMENRIKEVDQKLATETMTEDERESWEQSNNRMEEKIKKYQEWVDEFADILHDNNIGD